MTIYILFGLALATSIAQCYIIVTKKQVGKDTKTTHDEDYLVGNYQGYRAAQANIRYGLTSEEVDKLHKFVSDFCFDNDDPNPVLVNPVWVEASKIQTKDMGIIIIRSGINSASRRVYTVEHFEALRANGFIPVSKD